MHSTGCIFIVIIIYTPFIDFFLAMTYLGEYWDKRGSVQKPLTDLTPAHFCACHKPTSWIFVPIDYKRYHFFQFWSYDP